MDERLKRYRALVQSGDVHYMEPLPAPFTNYNDPVIRKELEYLWVRGFITFHQRPGRDRCEFLAIVTEDIEDIDDT